CDRLPRAGGLGPRLGPLWSSLHLTRPPSRIVSVVALPWEAAAVHFDPDRPAYAPVSGEPAIAALGRRIVLDIGSELARTMRLKKCLSWTLLGERTDAAGGMSWLRHPLKFAPGASALLASALATSR